MGAQVGYRSPEILGMWRFLAGGGVVGWVRRLEGLDEQVTEEPKGSTA